MAAETVKNITATGEGAQAANNITNNYYKETVARSNSDDNVRDSIAEKLKTRYRNLEVEKRPWISKEPLFVADFYSDLEMVTNKKNESPIKLENIFDDVEGGKPYRILVEGRPGVGKTTFSHKLAVDWARGEKYINERFKLVFLIALRHFDFTNIDEALIWLGKLTGIDDKMLVDYITQTHDDVLLILDGYDELPINKRKFLLPLLRSESYPMMTVIVTCRTNEFSSNCCFQDVITDSRAQILPDGIEFWRKKILISGMNREKGLDLLTQLLTEKEFDENKDDINRMFEDLKELWTCPLYLFMLAILIKESPVSIKTKTHLYISFFNLMVTRSLKRPAKNVDILQALKGNTASQPNYDSEVDKIVRVLVEFGQLALTEKQNGSTKFSEQDIIDIESKHKHKPDFLKTLGILTKVNDTYEATHHSLIEFLIALNLYASFFAKKNEETLLQTLGFIRIHYSLVLPFLAGLLNDDSYQLFDALKPFAYEYCACISYLVPLLLECEVSNQVLSSLISFLPALWPMPCCCNDSGFASTTKHQKIVKHGIDSGKIKVLSWKLNSEATVCENTTVDQLQIVIDGAFSGSDIRVPVIKCKDLRIIVLKYAMTEEMWEVLVNYICKIQATNVSLHILDYAEDWLPAFHHEILDGELKHQKFLWIKCCLRAKKQHLMDHLTELVKKEKTKGLELVFDKVHSTFINSNEKLCTSANACRNRECNNVLPRQVKKIMKQIHQSEDTLNVHLSDRERVMISHDKDYVEQKWLDICLENMSGKTWTWLRFWSVNLEEGKRELQIKVQQLDFVDVQYSHELTEALTLSEIKCLSIDSAFLCESPLQIEKCDFENLDVLDIVLTDACNWETVFNNLTQFQSISVLALTMPFTKLKEPFPTNDFLIMLQAMSNVQTLQFFGVNRAVDLASSILKAIPGSASNTKTLPVSVICLQASSYQEYISSSSTNRASQSSEALGDLLSTVRTLLKDFGLNSLQIVCPPNSLPQNLANVHAPISLESIFSYKDGFRITHDMTGMKADDPLNYRHDYDLFGGYHRFSVQLNAT